MAAYRVAEKESQKDLGFYYAETAEEACKEAKSLQENKTVPELEAFEVSMAF